MEPQTKMASRGRGRGMGIVPPPSPGVVESEGSTSDSKGSKVPLPGGTKIGPSSGQQTSHKTPGNIQEVQKYLMSLNEQNVDRHGKEFGDMIVRYIKQSPEKRAGEVASLFYQTITKSRNYSTLGGKVCAEVLNPEADKEIRALFRKELFRMCQGNYKQKEGIRKRSIEEWLGIFTFVTELYRFVRVSGTTIGALGSASREGIAFMLDSKDCTDDEVDCICTIVKSIGPMLESSDEQRKVFNDAVVNKLRTAAIRRETSENATCQILELLEFRARGYKDPAKELKDYYVEAYTDAIARDELFLAGIQD